MLRRLVLRDLRLTRTPLLANGAVFVAFLVYMAIEVSTPRVYGVFAAIMMAFLPVVIFAREDLAKAAIATCVLPVSRTEVVRARFAGAWLLMGGGLAAGLAIGAVVPGSRVGGTALLAPGVLLPALSVLALAAALLLPLAVRFGFTGVIAFLVTAQGIGLVLVLLARAGHGPRGGGGIGARIRSAAAAAEAALGPAGATVALLAALALLTLTSYRVCLALFRRREL
jgi:hypothetical protein